MSKRPSSPSLEGKSAVAAAPSTSSPVGQRQRTGVDSTSQLNRIKDADGDDDMGEFEDQFEDEFEEEDTDAVIAPRDSDDSDDDDGETMQVDGMKVDGKIQRPEDDEADAAEPEAQVYIPGTTKLEQGQTLEADQSAYEMLHRLNVTWPCLSFDHLKDHLGNDRQSYPHSSYMVAGTQADTASRNEILVMKASSLHKTQNDDGKFSPNCTDAKVKQGKCWD